ncbi:MAG: ABC transporter ATP-binding protein [Pseudobdellovibrio sp.]
MNPLEIKKLVKSYPALKQGGQSVEAVKDVTFSIQPGEIFGLLGPNGAGKTSIISTITTLEKPTSGSVQVFGVDVVQDPLFIKKQIGVVHQEIINTGFFNIEEILKFQSGYYGIRKNQDRIEYLLEKLALKEHRKKNVKQLSGGMKRRLMIAKALVHSPKLLLLDEPTAGVDVGLRESLWQFVTELKSEGISILLTTHYLEEAEKLCARVGIINKGKIIFNGQTTDAIAQYSTKKVHIELKSGSKLSFSDVASVGLVEILEKNNIQFSDIKNIKVDEGKLEEAFSKMVNL